MRWIALSESKDKLSAPVDEAESAHQIIQITRHGHPAAVIMSADHLESLHETLYWLSQPGIREDLTESSRDLAQGATASGEDLRQRFGLLQQ